MTYQAEFRQPRAHLNPLEVKMDAVVHIEIFPHGKRPVRWRARYLDRDGRPTPNGLVRWESKAPIEAPTPSMAQEHIRRLFEEQLAEWRPVLSAEEQRAQRMQ
jgi:hypothetical protein